MTYDDDDDHPIPAVGGKRPVRIFIVVDFPAPMKPKLLLQQIKNIPIEICYFVEKNDVPLCPNKARIWPFSTRSESPSTALTFPSNFFTKSVTCTPSCYFHTKINKKI